ncbi:hypothetical protein CRENBAI_010303, partial [Crenichthys baileyi]
EVRTLWVICHHSWGLLLFRGRRGRAGVYSSSRGLEDEPLPAPAPEWLEDELLHASAPAQLKEEPQPAPVRGRLVEEPLPSHVPVLDGFEAELPPLSGLVPVLEELEAELPPLADLQLPARTLGLHGTTSGPSA